jgi:ureidoglycolate hydrolase
MSTVTVTDVPAVPLAAAAFAPYGQVIVAADDGGRFGAGDAQLELDRGTPRFYLMRLVDRPPTFDRITRHRAVTQCLAAVGGGEWWLAVAPPDGVDESDAEPDLARLAAFTIPGDVAVKLHRGTWHAGPFFRSPTMSFFNLELADTNEVDHHTVTIGSHRIRPTR